MAKRKELTFTNFISINGAPPILMSELTPEQKKQRDKIWSERLSRVASEYFTQHPEDIHFIEENNRRNKRR